LEHLADLTGKQRDLQDETEQAQRNDQSEQELDPQELARRQAELRDLLENLGDTLPAEGEGEEGQRESGEGEQSGQNSGETGEGEGEGQSESQNGSGSGEGLEPGERGAGGTGELQEQFAEGLGAAEDAMRRSEEALEQGNLAGAGQAQEDAIRALREAGEALAEAVSRQGNEDGQDGNDPLGRSDNGFDNGNETADIDDRDNATRSRELLEELRRRAAEQQREAEEREYLERLLERF